MIKNHSDYTKDFQSRNEVKDLEGYIFSFLKQGTNCSDLECQAISKDIKSKINLFIPDAVLPGKLTFSAISIKEPAGKSLEDCKKVVTYLTLIDPTEDNIKKSSKDLRQTKIMRLTNEAFTQGALLTQEDLSIILNTTVRTIRYDIQELKNSGEIVPLRGFIRDIGRTISHKVNIIKQYLAGKEIVDLIHSTKHSITSIERYLTAFGRVIFLYKKNIPVEEISFITKVSLPLVKEYISIYEGCDSNSFTQNRILELTGEAFKKKSPQMETRS